jgi:integrase
MAEAPQKKEAAMACLYKRRKQYWASYYLNGRQVQKSLHTDNERVARNKLRKLEYELSIGDLPQASRLPLPALLETFCGHMQAKQTYKSYRKDVGLLRNAFGEICASLKIRPPGSPRGRQAKPRRDKYAGDHINAKFLEDVAAEAINRFLDGRIKRSLWSPKTVNGMRAMFHRLFEYAIKHHGFCSRDRRYPNPAAAVERRHEPAPEIWFLTLSQIEEQFAALKDHPNLNAIIATCIYAGLRREEATCLTHEDIDLELRLIRVRAKTIDGKSWQPKTRRNRVVPVSEALFEILRQHHPRHGGVWFFPSPDGKKWDPDNFSNDLRELNRAKGLPWSCGDFRHTFGSQLAQKGESLYKIATLMGNSPEICRRHYAALIPEEMHDTVEFAKPIADMDRSKDTTRQLLEEVLHRMDQT